MTTQTKKKYKPSVKGVNFSVWMLNGGPVPEEVQEKIEDAVERTILELFNEGHRLLTQTSKG